MQQRGVGAAALPSPARLLLAMLAVLWLCQLAAAQSVVYTVQVVALSEYDGASSVQNDLLRSGYPAYIVRSTSDQGDVFRVRVGAFADRNSALLYASGMPQIAGGRPVPALAEGSIPFGIMPLAPRLLADIETADLDLVLGQVPDGIAVRTQAAGGSVQADYLLVVDGQLRSYRAWRLGVDEDGELIRLRELLLWPENWVNDPDEVRAGFRSSLLSLVAERMALPVADLIAAEYRPSEDGPPRLFVVERGPTSLLEGSELLGVGLPAEGVSEFGPVAFLRLAAFPDEMELPGLTEPLALSELLAGEMAVVGSGWEATADGDYVRLTLTDPATAGVQATTAAGTTWRAGLGRPLWSEGRYLLAWLDGRLLIYDFVIR